MRIGAEKGPIVPVREAVIAQLFQGVACRQPNGIVRVGEESFEHRPGSAVAQVAGGNSGPKADSRGRLVEMLTHQRRSGDVTESEYRARLNGILRGETP